jgi:hypothetical protein
MFIGTSIGVNNYSVTLNGWSRLPSLQNGVELSGGPMYFSVGYNGKRVLKNKHNWVIKDRSTPNG